MEKMKLRELETASRNAYNILLTALGNIETDAAKAVIASVHASQGEVEITLTVNGVELPFIPVAEALAQAHHDDIERRALELSLEKMANLQSMMYDLEEHLKSEIRSKFPDALRSDD